MRHYFECVWVVWASGALFWVDGVSGGGWEIFSVGAGECTV